MLVMRTNSTNFTPWDNEVMIFGDTALHLYPLLRFEPYPSAQEAETLVQYIQSVLCYGPHGLRPPGSATGFTAHIDHYEW